MMLLPLVANAFDFEVDNFYYTILSESDRTCQVDGMKQKTEELIIPALVTHNNTTYSVVAIRDYAFYRGSSNDIYIKSVIIPEGIKTIGNGAFVYQNQLDYVTLPNSVERIGNSAFGRCPLLKMRKLVLPKNLKYLGYSSFGEDMYYTKDSIVTLVIQENVDSIDAFAFSAMKNLQKIIMLTNEPPTTYDSSGRNYGPFYGTGSHILYSSWTTGYWKGLYGERCEYISNYFEEDGIIYLPTSISPMTCDVIDCNYSSDISSTINIPEEVTHSGVTFKVNNIRSYAFNSNEYIKEIICNNNGRVDASTFANCISLVSVLFGDNITSLGSSVLENCANLTKVVLGQSINYIPDKAFADCESLSDVAYKGGIREIGSQAFANCSSLVCFNLPDNIESIRYSCFLNCRKLDKITIPISVSTIESSAFQGCASISEIVIPNSVISIGNSLFEECTNLKRVKLGDGISILQPIFKGCTSLNEIELGKNIKNIGESTFENLANLRTISIPCNVEKIGNMAFSGCTSLKNLTIERGEETLLLGYNKSDVFEVGKNTFSDCPLETISLGRNLSYESSSNFGYSPFYNISSLKDVVFDNTVTTISEYLFKDCIGLTSVIISDSAKSIEKSAFEGCSSLTSVTIGSGVNLINSSAFGNCAKLSDVFCFAKDVPVTDNNAFQDSHIESAILHVPGNSIYTYKESEPWKNFKNIVKIDMPKHTLTYIVDEEVYKICQIEEGETITPETEPTKEGYTFSGWSEIPETMPAHDVTVNGTFSINSYVLTYLVDGEKYKTFEIVFDTAITPEAEPTKEGYTFSGWSEIPATMPAHDVTVNGSFIVNNYTLTYKVEGVVYKAIEYAFGSVITPEAYPEKEGYTFSGWSEIPATMPAHDVVVTGSFTVNNYTLFYWLDGSLYKSVVVAYSAAITPEGSPEKEGYTFTGWQGIPATMPARDVDVYGYFNINSYQLTWVIDGVTFLTETLAYGQTIVAPVPESREGYDFAWDLTNVPATMPARNLTIYGYYTVGIEEIICDNNRRHVVYDLQGRLVRELVPGNVYIRDGKKFFYRGE